MVKNLKNLVKSKKVTKAFSVALAACMTLSSFAPLTPTVFAASGVSSSSANTAYNQSNPAYHYFYNQLNPNAQGIYRGMEKMFNDGSFMRGETVEITEFVSASSMALLANNNNQIFNDYGAARDAFQNDYPDCFYVDWDDLSIRVNQDSSGAFHCFLGAGKLDTYLLAGMNENRCENANWGYGTGVEGAVAQYNAELDRIVKAIKDKTLDIEEIEGDAYQGDANTTVELIGAAHDYLVKNMIYKHEEDLVSTDRWITRDGRDLGCKLYANDAHKDEHSTARTAYDAFIYQAGVCESYTRAFKAIMDRLGIPCVCVYGVYSPKSTVNEPHIWNYVMVDGKWYGVDVTHDDPTNDRWWTQRNSGHETREFWLVGENELMFHHFPTGVMSAANYEFEYPELSKNALRESYVNTTDEGIKVVVEKDTQFDDQTNEDFASGTFYISYNGKNYTQNAEEGKYIIARTYMYNPGSDTWTMSNWYYIDPWTVCYFNEEYAEQIESSQPKFGSVEDGTAEYYTKIEFPQVRRVEVAVTDIAPSYTSLKKEFYENFHGMGDRFSAEYTDWAKRFVAAMNQGAGYFQEAEDTLRVKSNMIENKWGTYVAPPTYTYCNPDGKISINDGKQRITMRFNENLKLKDGAENVVISVNATGGAGLDDSNAGSSAVKNCKIENIQWHDNEVSFDFTPSTMFADNYCYYSFQIETLVGVDSGKVPYPVVFGATYVTYCNRYLAEGEPWNIYGQPQLMDSNDIDLSGLTFEDGLDGGKEKTIEDYMQEVVDNHGDSEHFLESIKRRLTLVTSEASPNQNTQMTEAIATAGTEAVEGTTINTYNIEFMINDKCPCARLRDGMKLRICMGFPAGTCYEDYAETGRLAFKVYHYICDPESGKLTGEIEECECTVTKNGLIIMVDSFSPFAIVPIEGTGKPADTKELVVAAANGGSVLNAGETKLEGGDANIDIANGEQVELTIKPDEGYMIDSISLGGVRQHIDNREGQTMTVNYNQIATGDSLSVKFASSNILNDELSSGLNNQFEIPVVEVTTEGTNFTGMVGKPFDLKAVAVVISKDFDAANKDGSYFDEAAEIARAQGLGETPRDYVKYDWLSGYKRAQGQSGAVYDTIPEEVTPTASSHSSTLHFDNPQFNYGGQYYLVVTAMKWDEAEQKYKPMDGNTQMYGSHATSQRLILSFVGQLQFSLNTSDGKLVSAGSEENVEKYTLDLNHGDVYDLVPVMKRAYTSAIDVRNETRPITWKSSSDSVVSVDKTGHLTALTYSQDPVTITGTAKDIDGTEHKVEVTVTARKVDVGSVTIGSSADNASRLDAGTKTITLEVEESLTMHVAVSPDNASEPKVTWTLSGNEGGFVSFDDDTLTLTANKLTDQNVVTLTATADGQSDTYTVKVVPTKVASISADYEGDIHLVEPGSAEAGADTSMKITLNAIPDNATDKTLTAESNDQQVATVNLESNGKGGYVMTVTAVADGDEIEGVRTCKITVKSSNSEVTKEYNVTVSETLTPVQSVEIVKAKDETADEMALHVGDAVDFDVEITPSEAAFKNVEWQVVSGDAVTVSDSGHVHAVKLGDATVKVIVHCQKADCPTHEATINVRVVPVEVSDVTINGESKITLRKNDTTTLTAVVSPDNATDKSVTWKSEQGSIADVDAYGVVTAKSVGTTTITATAGGRSASVTVEVTPIMVEGVTIDGDKLSSKMTTEDKPLVLTATYYPEEADNVELVWESDKSEVASVDNGTVTPHAPGVANIKVYVKGHEEINQVYEVTVVAAKTDLTVYTVDQNKHFLAGASIQVNKITDGQEVPVYNSVSTSKAGKFVIPDLTNGEYVLYQSGNTIVNANGEDAGITAMVISVSFTVTDGRVVMLGTVGSETLPQETNSIVLINVVGDSPESARVMTLPAYLGAQNLEEYRTEGTKFDKSYEDFIENLPKGNEPVGPGPQEPTICEHNMTFVDAKDPTPEERGNIAYYYCDKCEKYFLDREGAHEIPADSIYRDYVAPEHKHNPTFVPGKEPTETEKGNNPYYYCEECGKYFLDIDCTQPIDPTQIDIPALGPCTHGDVDYIPRKEATCNSTGNIEYWHCDKCGKLFKDAAFETEVNPDDVILNMLTTHNADDVKHVQKKDPTETDKGNIEYWYCERCGRYFDVEDLSHEIDSSEIEIPALGPCTHEGVEFHELKPATCVDVGHKAHWHCEKCGKMFLDEDLTKAVEANDLIIPAGEHKSAIFVPAKDATYEQDGNIDYWFCETCGKYFKNAELTDEISKDATVVKKLVCEHANVKHVAKKDATYEAAGNIEYWYCPDCGKYFSDADLTVVIPESETVIPMKVCDHANVQHVAKKDATYTEAGNIEYWYCSDCGRYYTNAELTEVVDETAVYVPALVCNHAGVQHVAKKDATETDKGNIEYWYCPDCGKYFDSADLTHEIDAAQVEIPATGVCAHENVKFVEAKDATCLDPGHKAYWHCEKCGRMFLDEQLTDEVKADDVVIPASDKHAPVVHVPAKAATKDADGNIEYWFCETCGKYFSDEALTKEITKDQTVVKYEAPATCEHKNVQHVEKKEATKDADGNIEYWYCPDCGKYFSDSALTKEISKDATVVKYEAPATCEHKNVQHVDAKSATKDTDGNIEYWYCPDCGKYFSDSALTKEISKDATVVKYNQGVSESTQTPSSSTSSTDDGKGPGTVQTGDYQSNGLRLLLMGLAVVVAGVGVVALKGKKKKED